MRLQFSITICFSFFTAGWYVVTKVNSLSSFFLFYCLRADFLESKVTSDNTNNNNNNNNIFYLNTVGFKANIAYGPCKTKNFNKIK